MSEGDWLNNCIWIGSEHLTWATAVKQKLHNLSSTTIPIPKKDRDNSNPKNWRAISLLPNISKIYEVCINRSILKFCGENKLVDERQFGFKYKHSTTNAIHLLTSDINWSWNNQKCTDACFIDFEKAFDSIWIPGIWIIGCQKSLAIFPQACLCKRVVLVVFVASGHARAFWEALFTR